MITDSANPELRLGRPSLPRTVILALVVGWIAGTMLTLYVVPHPLMHSEWEKEEWKVAAADHSLSVAPFTYFGPPFLAAIVANIRHRRGWDSSELQRNLQAARMKAWRPISIALLGIHAALGFVIAFFLHVVGRV